VGAGVLQRSPNSIDRAFLQLFASLKEVDHIRLVPCSFSMALV
jgi:hypothetical protein